MSNQVSAHQCESHGELPCPDCGYLRRGVHHRDKCPECGARGFDGDFVFSGMGTMLTGVHRAFARRIVLITFVVFVLLLVPLLLSFASPTVAKWRDTIAPIYMPVLTLSFIACVGSSSVLIKSWRAREDLSAESTVWEVTPTGVNIRERGASPLLVPREKISHIEADTVFGTMSQIALKVTSRDRKVRSFSIHDPDAELQRLQVKIIGAADERQRCIDEISRILAVPVTKPVVQASGPTAASWQ